MKREDLLKRMVEEMDLGNVSVAELVRQMERSGGFGAKNMGTATDILRKMIADKNCKKFLSFPACVVSTGLRGAIAQAVEKGLFDVIITTCGTMDHDLARAWGGKYYHGAFELNDEAMHRLDLYRLGNITIPTENYGDVIEKNMQPILKELAAKKQEWGGRELIHEFGLRLSDRNSILYQAARRNVPVYVPGITDGAFGTNLVWFSQDNKFKVDVLKDERELADIAFDNKVTGALMLGGGISKHHTIWWNQFKGGLDYAVYITTASQYDGSLSGARLTEAVSWGKVKEDAQYVTVDGDVTILLPVILAALYQKP
ncbi:MAG: deoxyhypusine synthase [Candidatus Aenigmatarchaeota archaeon]